MSEEQFTILTTDLLEHVMTEDQFTILIAGLIYVFVGGFITGFVVAWKFFSKRSRLKAQICLSCQSKNTFN